MFSPTSPKRPEVLIGASYVSIERAGRARVPSSAVGTMARRPRGGTRVKRANGQCVKMLLITGIPFVAFLVAVVLLWHEAVGWPDLALLGGLYLVCGFGITVGFHRMAAHRAFAAVPVFKVTLLILGSMAVQGPVIKWVVDHRAHHAFSDRAGDPHSPHHDFPDTFAGRVRGLAHAHIGWMFEPQSAAERGRYARDLLADPAVRFIDRTFLVWGVLSFLLPLGAGYALSGGEPRGALTALLWGGPVRLFLNHHVSWSVNSICHAFG